METQIQNATLQKIVNSDMNVAETAAPAASTAFISISKYLEKESLTGKVASIDYAKKPLYSYKTADNTEKNVKGITFMDADKHQLCLLAVSEKLGQKNINEVAGMLGVCRVLVDTYQTQDANGKTITKTFYRLCSPAEVETEGNAAAVSL